VPTYFVDDGGNNSDGSTWANAYTSIQALDAAITIASGDIIYIGADSNCTDAAAGLTITGPSEGLPVKIISSTVGSGTTVSYSVGTGDQILATGGASDILFDGSFALVGIRVKAGRSIQCGPDVNEYFHSANMTVAIGPTGSFSAATTNGSKAIHSNLIIDLTQDGTTGRGTAVLSVGNGAYCKITGLSFVNPGYRTGTILTGSTLYADLEISGFNFSGFDNGTDCEIVTANAIPGRVVLSNGITKSSVVPFSSALQGGGNFAFTNYLNADAPEAVFRASAHGTLVSSTSIYRTGGGAVESASVGWLITTTALCSEVTPFYTPWIYGTIASTGSKTFDLYITNDTGDLTDAECWLEVEYLKDADEAQWFLATDQRATITATAAAQTDDTTSSWNGTGPAFIYKQKLSVTATVGETGQYRARVAVGKASIESSAYFYIDPKVTVT
jgi:hypothetical protein